MTTQERWRAVARAASFLYRAADARTTTGAGWLLEDAARLLCEAGLCDLADEAHEAAEAWTDADLAQLQSRVAEAAGKLEATYLETEM